MPFKCINKPDKWGTGEVHCHTELAHAECLVNKTIEIIIEDTLQ